MRQRHLVVIILAAVVIALLAWAVLASGKSDAPGAPDSRSKGTPPPLPEGRIYFSAGGTIYAVRPDGTELSKVIEGSRRGLKEEASLHPEWASSPAVSPDGSALAFVRGFDVWLSDLDGSSQRKIVDLANPISDPCCAASWGVGVNSVAWSPDAARLVYVASGVSTSGITQVFVANSDGGSAADVSGVIPNFMVANWLDGQTVLLYGDGAQAVGYGLGLGKVSQPYPGYNPYAYFQSLAGANVLSSPFMEERDLELVTSTGTIKRLAQGVAGRISPDGRWIAYLRGEELRLVAVEGGTDELVIDLRPLGGRDHHFADRSCYPGDPPPADPLACSYRPPVLSWGP